MQQPENQSKKYTTLFNNIDEGYIKIPQFQRDFVWTKTETAKLLDSIIKGFPIGTFIFWKTREELRYIREIGNAKLPPVPKGNPVQYVLDGQQRITSLYAVRKGLIMTREGKEVDYRDICINLDSSPDSDEEIVMAERLKDVVAISVHELLSAGIAQLVKKYPDHIEMIDAYQQRLKGYDFSTVLIDMYPIDIACEVFTRINTAGQELTLFQIMVAKTYDHQKKFDLAEKYQRLIDNNGDEKEKDLEDVGYETVPEVTVLQCIAAHVNNQIRRRDILKIPKPRFIDSWPVVKDGIFHAVDYLCSAMRIPVSRLVPYPAQLVPLSYFFICNKGKNPTAIQKKLLTQFFFWVALSNRYSSGVEGKIAQDLKRIDLILQEEPPDYTGEELNLAVDDLRYYFFRTGDAFCRAILCIFAYLQPKCFETNSLVQVGNAWLKTRSSRNYHHFFPRAYLRKQGVEDWKANSIMNITIVPAGMHKREIGAKPPSRYMKKLRRKNEDLEETMKSHLITDLDRFGVWDDDYEKFLEARGNKVLTEINKRLNPKI